MPLPRAVARLNKRFTNQLIEPVVRRFAGYAVVAHVGRRTGRHHRTPVYGFDAGGGAILIALTYGPAADWVQNVLVGGGSINWRGSERRIVGAQIVGRNRTWPHLPRLVRCALRLLRVNDFMLVNTNSTAAH